MSANAQLYWGAAKNSLPFFRSALFGLLPWGGHGGGVLRHRTVPASASAPRWAEYPNATRKQLYVERAVGIQGQRGGVGCICPYLAWAGGRAGSPTSAPTSAPAASSSDAYGDASEASSDAYGDASEASSGRGMESGPVFLRSRDFLPILLYGCQRGTWEA